MLDELKQALDRQKTGGAEEDFVEVLVRIFEVDRGLIDRIMFAQKCLSDLRQEWRISEQMWDHKAWEERISDPELRQAIRYAVNDGACRVVLARAIQNNINVTLPVKLLVPEDNKNQICNGCPKRLTCDLENYSTPENCWSYAKRAVNVRPLRILKDNVEVQAAQPIGKFLIPIRLIEFSTLPDLRPPWEPGNE